MVKFYLENVAAGPFVLRRILSIPPVRNTRPATFRSFTICCLSRYITDYEAVVLNLGDIAPSVRSGRAEGEKMAGAVGERSSSDQKYRCIYVPDL